MLSILMATHGAFAAKSALQPGWDCFFVEPWASLEYRETDIAEFKALGAEVDFAVDKRDSDGRAELSLDLDAGNGVSGFFAGTADFGDDYKSWCLRGGISFRFLSPCFPAPAIRAVPDL
ncbi:hypothetical protein [Croceicoccus naphthovorans]|uniref:Uncharacterized protein n=1 Tax=Croceicoccus naphthovorans TaxID=1348774 RepID=A0A0G3XHK6_9SPHN|nr:hypothetical protein [Croceicoccus naphthovorans]AKM10682.1 hypothetical protein AB433_13030 [Croceicoccus naphthovorans]MBB3988921.1 hypothetical protein [Croceicoccus naphthovorans]